MKAFLYLVPLVLLGCDPEPPRWYERYTPTTPEERVAVTEAAERILNVTPRTLSGRNQGWDDAIRMAYTQAAQAICRPTYWEYKQASLLCEPTGKWRYADEPLKVEATK